MSGERQPYDLLVAGGGLAGCAAAGRAAAGGLRVALVERSAEADGTGPATWIGPAAAKLLAELKVPPGQWGTPFKGLTLRAFDFKHAVAVQDEALAGHVVDSAALRRALLAATHAGDVQIERPTEIAALHLGEHEVTAELSCGRRVAGRILIVADGAGGRTADLANLVPARDAAGQCAAAAWSSIGGSPSVDVLLGTGAGLRLAVIVRGPTGTSIVLRSAEPEPATAQLRALIRAAQAAGALPADFDGRPVTVPALAGTALELDTHVGKRCLLVGDAGGFMAAFSGEGLYPALCSGRLAAETAAAALQAGVLQDELAGFSAAWRGALAEYLRLPNTDLGLLLPMVFRNAQMSKRIARAFLLGQAF